MTTRVGPLETRVTIYPCGKVVLDGPRLPVPEIDFSKPDWYKCPRDPNEITDLSKGSYLTWQRDIAFYEAHMKAKKDEADQRYKRGPAWNRNVPSLPLIRCAAYPKTKKRIQGIKTKDIGVQTDDVEMWTDNKDWVEVPSVDQDLATEKEDNFVWVENDLPR